MLHYIARSVLGTLLFHDWREGLRLFRALLERAPGADVVVMPDHIHLLTEQRVDLAPAMSGYARWRNHTRNTRGPVWEPAPPPAAVAEGQRRRRAARYVYLNPCRAKLVSDPLAWPLSTYRDAVGLAMPPLRARVSDPARLHGYVARDDTVGAGSLLPRAPVGALVGDGGMRAVEAAVSEVTRLPMSSLRVRGVGRSLLAVAIRELVVVRQVDIAAHLGQAPRTLRDLKHIELPEIALVRSVLLDPRFPGLAEGDLRRRSEWLRYAADRRFRE